MGGWETLNRTKFLPFHFVKDKKIQLLNVQLILHKQVKRFESLQLHEKIKPSNIDDVKGVESRLLEQKNTFDVVFGDAGAVPAVRSLADPGGHALALAVQPTDGLLGAEGVLLQADLLVGAVAVAVVRVALA